MSTVQHGQRAPLFFAAIVACCWGLAAARDIVVPFLIAVFIAAVTAPLVIRLRDRGLPKGVAVAIGLIAALVAITGLGVLLSFALSSIGARVPDYQMRAAELLEEITAWLGSHGVALGAESVRSMIDPGVVMDGVGTLFRSMTGMVSRLMLMMLLVGFLLLESTTFGDKLHRVLRDEDDFLSLREAVQELNAYLFIKTLTSAVTGLLAGIVCWSFGLDLPLAWGLLACLLNYIPTVGSIIAAIPPTLLALVMHDWGAAVGVLVAYVVINFTIGNLVEPRVMGRALGLSPFVVFLSMVIWYAILGPVGALVSGPLTMLLRIWLLHTADLHWIGVLLGPSDEEEEGSGAEAALES